MPRSKLKWQRLQGLRNLKGRAGHTSTLIGKEIYILGGRNGNEFFNDMWVFDTEAEQWKLLQAKTPVSPRAYHTCTLVNDRELWVIGGSDPKTMHADIHVFDVVSSKWSSPCVPSMKPRGTHSAVLHPLKKDAILIYGGYGGPKSCWLNDLVVFHTDTLEYEELEPDGQRPLGRGYHTLNAFGKYVALFGGKAEGGIISEDKLSIYDVESNRWSMVSVKGDAPSPRSNHASTVMDGGLIIIHGGRHGSVRLNDSYLLRIPTASCKMANLELSWHVLERPENPTNIKKTAGKRSLEMAKVDAFVGRSAHSLTSVGQALYVFGGYGGEGLTFADIFVLRRLPKLPPLEVRKQTVSNVGNGKLLVAIAGTIGEEEEEEEEEEGWRNTKQPKLQSKKQQDTLLASAVAVKLHGSGLLHQEPEPVMSSKEKCVLASDTKSTEPIRKDGYEARAVTSLEERSIAVLLQEKELYEKELRSLQESVETLRASIKDKVVDSDFQQKSAQLEQEVQRLHKENLEYQSTIRDLEKEMAHQSKKFRRVEQENKFLKEENEKAKLSLEEKENARKMEISKMEELEMKLQHISKSNDETKVAASEAGLERDKYKSCVQALETELEKQMDALRQVSSRFEGEKGFLLNEIAERRAMADKLLTELGASKECLRSLEEANSRQAKEVEQEAAKAGALQKEKEALTCSNAVMASENKQLMEARQASEDNCTLLRSELQAARVSAEQHEAEAGRMREKLEQTREHASALHESLNKTEEKFCLQVQENDKLRALLREAEDFEQAQVRLLQAHVEKLRCARQSCQF